MTQILESDIKLIYELNFDKIYRFFYYKVLSRSIAQDLTSDSFMTFVEHCRSNTKILDLNKYLWGIVRRNFLKYLREKYNEPINMHDDVEKFAEYAIEFIEENEADDSMEIRAKKYIKFLPSHQAEILFKRLIEKKNLQQIADEIGKDMNYVKVTQKRGVANLRKFIDISK